MPKRGGSMEKKFCEKECRARLDELSLTVDRLAAHNLELKTLILRHGDTELKNQLEKLMKKYSGSKVVQDVA